MSNYDLFISYSSKDRSFVHRLAHYLKGHGVRIWLDDWEMLPGDRLRNRINDAIEHCRYVLIVLSPNSIQSPWVKVELDSAMIRELQSNETIVLPIILGELNESQIPPDLRGKLYLNFNSGETYERNTSKILKLLAATGQRLPFEYRIICSDTDIDIRDESGAEVRINKSKHLRVLDDQLVYVHEEFYSDGSVDEFEVSPGRITSIKRILGKLEIFLDFGRVLRRGDEIKQLISCTYHNSFLAVSEHWETLISHPNDLTRVVVRFPITRPYKTFSCTRRAGIHETLFHIQPKPIEIDSRPCLVLEIPNPNIRDYYLMKWTW